MALTEWKLSTITTESKNVKKALGRMNLPTNRPPPHPGEIVLEDFLKPLGISQRQLADAIHLPYRYVSEILHGRRSITAAVALRLAIYLRMSVEFWMNGQRAWDLYHALQSDEKILKAIEPLHRPDLPELMKLAGIEEKDAP